MSSLSTATAVLLLSLATSVAAQRRPGSSSGAGRAARLAAGAIAGIVVGSVIFLLLLCLCCFFCLRRRRSRTTGAPAPMLGSYGRIGGFGKHAHNPTGPVAQEAGYGPGSGQYNAPQGAWNQNATPASGGHYQPPPGAPPTAPQPGGFVQAPANAHTRPY
ncbi:hypothetical protein C8Q76DRAFT_793003 [Earliella scabrosa]|nr:hypothetical protein C8Q76DRAFT_793003 [Earliella scabrosa]